MHGQIGTRTQALPNTSWKLYHLMGRRLLVRYIPPPFFLRFLTPEKSHTRLKNIIVSYLVVGCQM